MSKGEERRVLRNREEKFGWSGERDLSFPSYIYFLTILSVSHLSNFDSRFFCSFGRFTSCEDRWKASAQLEGEEDCEVLTTMGLIHQACVCTNFVLFYIKVYAVHASKLIRLANKHSMFHNYVPRYLQICNV